MKICLKYYVLVLTMLYASSTIGQSANQANTFKTIVNGDWYEPTFIREIQKTKSPYKSRNSLAEFVELYVDTRLVDGDSISIGAPGIHEYTTRFYAFFRPGLTPNACPTNLHDEKGGFYEFGYSMNKDTSLIIYRYSSDKKLLGSIRYFHVPASEHGPLQYMVNKTLFTGTYRITDTDGHISTIHFTSDGELSGLRNFTKYFVLCDFIAAGENSLDQIFFEDSNQKRTWFNYSIAGNIIKLYDYKENDDQRLKRGHLKYTLVKESK